MSATTIEAGAEGFEFLKPKVVEKVFNLPLVTDTYDSLAELSTPLHPYMEKAGSIASPVAFTVKAGIESMTPEMIQTGYNSAKGQVCHSISSDICTYIFCRWLLPQRQLMPAFVPGLTALWTRFLC